MMTIKRFLYCLPVFAMLLVPASDVHAIKRVASKRKNITHIQLFHVYSEEYEGNNLKGKKIVEFGFGKGKSFTFYGVDADAHIKIKSMDGEVIYDKTLPVTSRNFSGNLCHLEIPDEDIKTNKYGEEGIAEITATLKDGTVLYYGPKETRLYRLPTSGFRDREDQIFPSAAGFDFFAAHSDEKKITNDAYQRLGSVQGMASDDQDHLLCINAAEPGAKGRYTHMIIYYTLGGTPVYQPVNKKQLGHANDATYYNGKYYVAANQSGVPYVTRMGVTRQGNSLKLSYQSLKLNAKMKRYVGKDIAAITYCNGKKYKGKYPIFVFRKKAYLYRCYLKNNTFYYLNRIKITGISSNLIPQHVTYYNDTLYLGYALLNEHGDQTNHLLVATVPYKSTTKNRSIKVNFICDRQFNNMKGVEVEGMAFNRGMLYYNMNGLDKYGKQMDFVAVEQR